MNPANVHNTDLSVNIYPCHTARIFLEQERAMARSVFLCQDQYQG